MAEGPLAAARRLWTEAVMAPSAMAGAAVIRKALDAAREEGAKAERERCARIVRDDKRWLWDHDRIAREIEGPAGE